jgi:hypothetical protein
VYVHDFGSIVYDIVVSHGVPVYHHFQNGMQIETFGAMGNQSLFFTMLLQDVFAEVSHCDGTDIFFTSLDALCLKKHFADRHYR